MFRTIIYRAQVRQDREESSPSITSKVSQIESVINNSNLSRDELLNVLVERVGSKLAENQIKILILISENAGISKRELSELIKISTTAIDKNIEKLKKVGILQRIGPAKGGFWRIIKDKKN